jgi:hypothetical protein
LTATANSEATHVHDAVGPDGWQEIHILLPVDRQAPAAAHVGYWGVDRTTFARCEHFGILTRNGPWDLG